MLEAQSIYIFIDIKVTGYLGPLRCAVKGTELLKALKLYTYENFLRCSHQQILG
jgi:hypothetical protein